MLFFFLLLLLFNICSPARVCICVWSNSIWAMLFQCTDCMENEFRFWWDSLRREVKSINSIFEFFDAIVTQSFPKFSWYFRVSHFGVKWARATADSAIALGIFHFICFEKKFLSWAVGCWKFLISPCARRHLRNNIYWWYYCLAQAQTTVVICYANGLFPFFVYCCVPLLREAYAFFSQSVTYDAPSWCVSKFIRWYPYALSSVTTVPSESTTHYMYSCACACFVFFIEQFFKLFVALVSREILLFGKMLQFERSFLDNFWNRKDGEELQSQLNISRTT